MPTSTGNRVSEKEAGYMELRGAQKDADCSKVEVKGGISTRLGCCNLFEPVARSVQEFRCGVCEYVQIKEPNYLYGG